MSIKIQFKQSLGETDFDIDLSLPGNGISALFGRSGSGKTTLINVISGWSRQSKVKSRLVIMSFSIVMRVLIYLRTNAKLVMYFKTHACSRITP